MRNITRRNPQSNPTETHQNAGGQVDRILISQAVSCKLQPTAAPSKRSMNCTSEETARQNRYSVAVYLTRTFPCNLNTLSGSEAKLQPKSNLVHFSFKVWHMVATILMIFRNCTNQRNHNQSREDFSRFLVRGRGPISRMGAILQHQQHPP